MTASPASLAPALLATIDRAMPPAVTTGAARLLVLSVLGLPVHREAWSLLSDDA